MTTYLILSTLLFAWLTLIWSKSGWFNFGLKAIFFGLFVYGLLLSLGSFGLLIKV